jgi:hypothetical protein
MGDFVCTYKLARVAVSSATHSQVTNSRWPRFLFWVSRRAELYTRKHNAAEVLKAEAARLAHRTRSA